MKTKITAALAVCAMLTPTATTGSDSDAVVLAAIAQAGYSCDSAVSIHRSTGLGDWLVDCGNQKLRVTGLSPESVH